MVKNAAGNPVATKDGAELVGTGGVAPLPVGPGVMGVIELGGEVDVDGGVALVEGELVGLDGGVAVLEGGVAILEGGVAVDEGAGAVEEGGLAVEVVVTLIASFCPKMHWRGNVDVK